MMKYVAINFRQKFYQSYHDYTDLLYVYVDVGKKSEQHLML